MTSRALDTSTLDSHTVQGVIPIIISTWQLRKLRDEQGYLPKAIRLGFEVSGLNLVPPLHPRITFLEGTDLQEAHVFSGVRESVVTKFNDTDTQVPL